jgi:bacterioferritin-associated ferredoxin
MSRKLVCLCNFIEEKEIVATLKKGANSAKDIQEITGAGTSCGRCLPEIDQLVEDWQKEKPKEQQKKLDFGL